MKVFSCLLYAACVVLFCASAYSCSKAIHRPPVVGARYVIANDGDPFERGWSVTVLAVSNNYVQYKFDSESITSSKDIATFNAVYQIQK